MAKRYPESYLGNRNGVEMKVYKNRMQSLRDIAAMAHGRGNDQTYLVYGDRRIGFTDHGDGQTWWLRISR